MQINEVIFWDEDRTLVSTLSFGMSLCFNKTQRKSYLINDSDKNVSVTINYTDNNAKVVVLTPNDSVTIDLLPIETQYMIQTVNNIRLTSYKNEVIAFDYCNQSGNIDNRWYNWFLASIVDFPV